jgi:hypothetical protein
LSHGRIPRHSENERHDQHADDMQKRFHETFSAMCKVCQSSNSALPERSIRPPGKILIEIKSPPTWRRLIQVKRSGIPAPRRRSLDSPPPVFGERKLSTA